MATHAIQAKNLKKTVVFSPAELPSYSQEMNSCSPNKVSTAPPVLPALLSQKVHLENTAGINDPPALNAATAPPALPAEFD